MLIKEATVALKFIQRICPNKNFTTHQQEQQQNNISSSTVPNKLIKAATAAIIIIHPLHNLVTTSLQSMRAWLTLLVESFSKDDKYFKSFKSTVEDMKRAIFVCENSYKSSSSSSPATTTATNFVLLQDATKIILKCEIEEMDIEIKHIIAQCEESNRIIDALSGLFNVHK